MTDEQMGAILTELLRITRGFGEAVRQISEMKAEIVALQWILEKKGVAYADELDAAREEALKRLKSIDSPSTPPSFEMPRAPFDVDNEWKM